MSVTVEFPSVASPTVSIVMVTYGGWEWVEPALRAIADHTGPCYEVIVVDNASPDATAAQLGAHVAGAKLVFNDANLGFGLAANQGALHATGRYLLFLNSDAYVEPGWLAPLLEVLETRADVGVAAPCLLEPDGRLQEAAGIVGGEGYVGQFGMGADAGDPTYRFRREVDYASGAALLVRRRDFLRVGGFDPIYPMGYYEDVDLCFTLWEFGLSTVYEPRSRIVHLRGASGSQELAMRHAIPNHGVFVRKWADELTRRPPVSDLDRYPHRLVASRDARTFDRILIVTERVPSGRLARIALELAAHWSRTRVTLIATGEVPAADVAAADTLLAAGVEVVWGEDWEAWFEQRRFHFSMAWVAGPDAHECFDGVLRRTQPQATRVYDGAGLDASHLPDWPDPVGAAAVAAEWARTTRSLEVERRAIASADLVATPDLLPPPIATAPAPFVDRAGVVYVGDHLRREVLMAVGDAGLTADLHRARLCVAPLGVGRGRAEILVEAMAAGLPFVTTSVGAQGLDLNGLTDLVVADRPDQFAAKADRLYRDASAWTAVQTALLERAPRPATDPLGELMAAAGLLPVVPA